MGIENELFYIQVNSIESATNYPVYLDCSTFQEFSAWRMLSSELLLFQHSVASIKKCVNG